MELDNTFDVEFQATLARNVVIDKTVDKEIKCCAVGRRVMDSLEKPFISIHD
jgi:hypothetical protein